MLYTKDQFIQQFRLDHTIGFDDFCGRLAVLNGSDRSGQFVVRASLDDFLARWATRDDRLSRLDLYRRQLYNMLVQEPEKALGQWFDQMVALDHPLEYYFDIPKADIFDGTTFSGRTNAKYGRVCKNLNFQSFYNTRKLYANDFEYTFGLMRAMFEDFKLRNSLVGPAFFDHICQISNSDYKQFWADFMMGCNRASVFNPATYRGILDQLFQGHTLFAPVMGWNAYQLGFYSSSFQHLVATDVIPDVVQNGHMLQQRYQQYASGDQFFESDSGHKTVDLYLCPSEQLDGRHQFVQRYRDQVDAVLFSPPYFDLEIYDSADQSLTSFPDYDQWLVGYWEETVKLCQAVMRPGARFGFVISNYKNAQKQMTTISEHMRDRAQQHLQLLGHYRVQWSAMGGSRQAKKTRDGNFEDLWLFEKPST